ncbi:MAG: ankyrin repeat domain-containing protein [Pseudomonadota bacterium]
MDQRLLRILGGDAERYPKALESQYPRVLGKIMSLWNSPEIDAYFGELMLTQRDRAGFPPDVASEIMHLSLVHTARHPENTKHDIWDNAGLFADFVPQALVGEVEDWVEPPDSIKREIHKLGIPCTAEGFLHAVVTGNRLAVTLFMDAKVNLETRDERGWTPLMLAAHEGCHEIVGILLQHGAYINAADMGGNMALHWAAFSGQHISVKLLLASGADINVANSSGLTPLLQAVAHHHPKVAALLLNNGAHPDAADRDGCTALHKAAGHGDLETIRSLVHHGGNIQVGNHDGDTPLQLAIKNKQAEAMKLLMSIADSKPSA